MISAIAEVDCEAHAELCIGGGRLKSCGGAEHCYLRGLSLSRGVWGHAPPGNTARRLNLGAFEAKNSIIFTILSNE